MVILDLDVVKLPNNPKFLKTSNSLTINLNPSNLPTGSYDKIEIKCIYIENEPKDKNGTCNKSSNNCTCNDLKAGKEYKIVFITIKENLPNAVSDNTKNQFTSMKKYFYFKVFDYYKSYLNKL